jgi:hypothetical protein
VKKSASIGELGAYFIISEKEKHKRILGKVPIAFSRFEERAKKPSSNALLLAGRSWLSWNPFEGLSGQAWVKKF